MKTIRKLMPIAFWALFLWACDTIHEDPGTGGVDPYLVDVRLAVEINMNFDGEISPATYAAYSSMLEGDYDIRYIVDIYKAPDSHTADLTERVARLIHTSGEVSPQGNVTIAEHIALPASRYVMLAWIDFVKKGSDSDLYYRTQDLTAVSILTPDGSYVGYNATKDAFCGRGEIDLTPFRAERFVDYTVTCPARRPLAMYRIITTDVGKYIAAHGTLDPDNPILPASTALAYQLYFPMGYNVQFGHAGTYTVGVGYRFPIDASGREAIVASDYVLVSDDTFFFVDFEVSDTRGRHISAVNGLRINLKRNMLTTIYDEFLTKAFDNGGIGVDDRFEGDEIVVRID